MQFWSLRHNLKNKPCTNPPRPHVSICKRGSPMIEWSSVLQCNYDPYVWSNCTRSKPSVSIIPVMLRNYNILLELFYKLFEGELIVMKLLIFNFILNSFLTMHWPATFCFKNSTLGIYRSLYWSNDSLENKPSTNHLRRRVSICKRGSPMIKWPNVFQ